MVFYGIADTFNIHNNYEGGQWNVLADDEGHSQVMWGRLTKDTDLQYNKTLITDDQKEIDRFVRAHMDKWAEDSNLYQSTLTQLQMLRTDFSVRNKDTYDDRLWADLISDYYKAMAKHHGG
jgi:hypothetical protein